MLLISFKNLFSFLVGFLLFIFGNILVAQESTGLFYDLNLKIIHQTKTLEGRLEIYSNNIDSAAVHMLIESFKKSSSYDSIFVDFSTEFPSIYFKGHPHVAKNPPWDGGFVWEKDDEENPFIGVACQEEGPLIWWPAFEALALRPDSMVIHLTVEQPFLGISNGRLIGITPAKENGFHTYHWKVSYPINAYNVSIYIGNYDLISSHILTENEEKLSLAYYPLAYNKEKAATHFQQTKTILKTFEALYGPYPFLNDGYKLVEAPYWGMEHQSAIAYGNGYKNDDFGIDFIILHESAHEYWGNSVTMKNYSDLWIHEAMATYTEVLFVEKTKGKSTAQQYLNRQKSFIKNTEAIAGQTDQRKYQTADMYFKGSWMMHGLRNLYCPSDSLWFSYLKNFYQKFKGQFIDRKDFASYWSSILNEDLSPYFDIYLYHFHLPTLFYEVKGNTLSYHWSGLGALEVSIPIKINEEKHDLLLSQGDKQVIHSQKIKSLDFPKDSFLFNVIKK